MRKFVVIAVAGLLLGSCAQAPEPGRVPPPREREDLPREWAEFQSLRRLPPGMTELDPALLRNAQAQAAKMPRYATTLGGFVDGARAKAAPRWESLGPDNIAGRTRTLVFDPRNPDRLLAGGVSGGVWESTNAGETWRVLSDEAQNINIGALAIDPVEPDVVYAGTGELYRNSAQPYSAMWGQGILRSRDGGRTFQQLAATANDDFRYVSDIVVSRVDHNRIYAATNTGIWRSNDAGASFTRLLRPTDGDNPRYEGCNDLLALPDATRDRLLAVCSSRSTADRYWLPGTILPDACGTNTPCPSAVFRNDDAAGNGAFVPVLSEPGMGRATLDYARSNPNVVYAAAASIAPGFDRNGDGIGDYENGLHAVFRSSDGGATWSARVRNSSPDALSTYLFAYADAFENQRCFGEPFNNYSAGWYNQAIAVDPLNENVVWVAGMEIYRSDDGGTTFGKASYWWVNPASPQFVHADDHYLAFDPRYGQAGNRRLYVTHDGGISRTEDATAPLNRGDTAACAATAGTVAWRELTRAMATTQFYTGAVTADGSRYLGGLQDNGTVLNTTNGTQRDFRRVFGGDGASVAFDPRDPNTFYVSYQGFNVHRTTNNGTTFTRATSGFNDATIFIVPYILDPLAPDRLYAGGTRLWRTDDQGRSWRPVSATFGNQFADRVSALAVSPVDANRMLVGNQRRIFRSTSALSSSSGTAWASASPREGWVSSLVFDPVAASTAYATYSTFGGNHVWRTDDSGATWRAIDGSGTTRLPDIPVHTLAIDPNNRERLFVGTDLGVFVSVDGGANWAVENAGFANVIVESLQVARNAVGGPRLYAFTYGRGVWRVPLADLDGVASYAIGTDTSGAFYNAQQSGHGWLVESVIADGVPSLIAAWYTYLDGEPRWLYGSGPVTNGRATLSMSIGRGGQFPPNFTGATIEPWGTLSLEFADADHGTAFWTTSYPGFTNGSMPFERLAGLAQAATGNGIQPCTSGSYFNAQQPGHGLQVQVIGPPEARQLLVVWYAYLGGAQRWFIGNGPIVGDTATVPLVSTRGGRFPPNFDPAAVVREDWGTLTFRAIDANRARIDWDAVQSGYADGGLDLVRLSSLRGQSCTP
jgi:photosystem II stability/assembly factor-like uncharacterized protein